MSNRCIPNSNEIINTLTALAQSAQTFATTLNQAVQGAQQQPQANAEVDQQQPEVVENVEVDQQQQQPEVDQQQQPEVDQQQPEVVENAEVDQQQQQQQQPEVVENAEEEEGKEGGRTRKRRMHKRGKTHRKKVITIRKKNKGTHKRLRR